jgi:hypothetical protein
MVNDKKSKVSNLSSPSKARSLHCHSPREDIFTFVPGSGAKNVITPSVMSPLWDIITMQRFMMTRVARWML